MKILLGLLASGLTLSSAAPVKLIIDTDAGLDVDDVVAMCVGNALADNGEAELISLAHTNGFDKGIGRVSSIMHYYNRDYVPLGAYKGRWADSPNGQDNYLDDLVRNLPGPIHDSSQVPTAVEAYRKALAAQPDHSVHIASIGITTNMRDLVQSGPDQYSPLSGPDLIAQKVKLIIWMDGGYNFGCAAGMLNNDQYCYGSAKIAVEGFPSSVKQIFSTLGGDILSGQRLPSCTDLSNPCRAAMVNWPGDGAGRSSWDPLVVVAAVRGPAGIYTREEGYGGHQNVDENGSEHWVNGNDSNQTYLVYDGNVQDAIRNELDDLLCQKPGPKTPTPAPPPTPPTPAPEWTQWLGHNCWDGHGAHTLEVPIDSSCGHMSIEQCEQRCVDTPGCTGVTVTKDWDSDTWSCFRKNNINPSECDRGTQYDTYTMNNAPTPPPGWTPYYGYNCWDGHGAHTLEDPIDSSCGHMSIEQCESKCLDTPGCTGVVVRYDNDGTGRWSCFRKSDVVPNQCDHGTEYDTYVFNRANKHLQQLNQTVAYA